MAQQITDHLRRDAQLAVGEQLDENGAEQGIVGRAYPTVAAARRRERRSSIATGHEAAGCRVAIRMLPPASRQELWRWSRARSPARSASSTATRCRRSVTSRATSASSRTRPGYRDGRRPLAPQVEEMRLAATRRAVQHQGSGRPIGPPVEPSNRRRIAVRHQKIGAAQRRAAGQAEGELRHRVVSQSLLGAPEDPRPAHEVGEPDSSVVSATAMPKAASTGPKSKPSPRRAST